VTRKKSTLHKDQCRFFTISHSLLLRMRNVSGKPCREFIFNNFFFKNRTVYEIKWKNIVQPDRPQMTIWHMRITCWIPKATDAHSEYVIPTAFPLQQWLHESASVLHYTYIACLDYWTNIEIFWGMSSRKMRCSFWGLGGTSSLLFLEMISKWRQKSPLKSR
jgi:hypothetical protein